MGRDATANRTTGCRLGCAHARGSLPASDAARRVRASGAHAGWGQTMKWARGILVVVLPLVATPAFGYLKLGIQTGSTRAALKWARPPVRYAIESRSVPGVSVTDFQTAVGRAFATWEAVPTASISYQFAGFTAARAGAVDGQSTLGF